MGGATTTSTPVILPGLGAPVNVGDRMAGMVTRVAAKRTNTQKKDGQDKDHSPVQEDDPNVTDRSRGRRTRNALNLHQDSEERRTRNVPTLHEDSEEEEEERREWSQEAAKREAAIGRQEDDAEQSEEEREEMVEREDLGGKEVIVNEECDAASGLTEQYKSDLDAEAGKEVLPDNLGEVLLSNSYRKYIGQDGGVMEDKRSEYEKYKWFVFNILFSVNYELTELLAKEVKDHGYEDWISKTYTVSDEAFAILCVVNYKQQWRNDSVLYPTKDKNKMATDPLYTTTYTSSKKGYCKLPWGAEGVQLYNELLTKIGNLRGIAESGIRLEGTVKREMESINLAKKQRRVEVIETRPMVCGALRKKLESLKRN